MFDNKYQIISELGSGDMSSVYRCLDLNLSREVALKIMRTEHMLDKTALLRFQREGRSIASLSHANIVSILGSHVTAKQQPYLVMEIVDGRSLAKMIQESGPLEYPTAVRLARQIANALAYIHSQKIIHRDLKPANIMVSAQNHVKLLDFGIAKTLADESFKATRTGESVGTPLYMSPEQSLGKTVDTRTDQYSLGCVLFEMLTGRPPYVAENPVELSLLHAQEPSPLVNKFSTKKIPLKMEVLITKLLSKNPENRYDDMVEVRETLNRFAEALTHKPTSIASSLSVAIAICAVLVIGGIFIYAMTAQHHQTVKADESAKSTTSKDDPLNMQMNADNARLAKYMIDHPNDTDFGAKFKDSHITDDGLHVLIGHNNLELIDFGRCAELTDACADTLVRLPIRRLVLGGTNVGDDAARILMQSRTLDYVDFTSTKVTNKSCDYFPRFAALSQLNIAGTTIDNEGLKKLGSLPRFRHLNIGETNAKGVAFLLGMPNLENLTLNGLALNKPDFEIIAKLKKLKKLALNSATFDPDDMLLLKSLPMINLSVHNIAISSDLMQKLKKQWPHARIDNGK